MRCFLARKTSEARVRLPLPSRQEAGTVEKIAFAIALLSLPGFLPVVISTAITVQSLDTSRATGSRSLKSTLLPQCGQRVNLPSMNGIFFLHFGQEYMVLPLFVFFNQARRHFAGRRGERICAARKGCAAGLASPERVAFALHLFLAALGASEKGRFQRFDLFGALPQLCSRPYVPF